jgi:hypothetical protein
VLAGPGAMHGVRNILRKSVGLACCIAAATSFIKVRLNGHPILVLTQRPSLRIRLRRKLGLTEPSGYRILVPETRR